MTGDDAHAKGVRQSYDRVAAEYAARIFDELRDKPFDRARLDRFIDRVLPLGPSLDLGCGPGQVARYLHDGGLQVIGVDLSPEMIAEARRLSPEVSFHQSNMLTLDFAGASVGGITAFYSLIHIPRDQLPAVLAEFWRVLVPGGLVLLTFHLGDEDRHLDEWWGHDVSLDFYFFDRAEIERHLQQAGFIIDEALERDPYPEVEHQSRRAYLLARKPTA